MATILAIDKDPLQLELIGVLLKSDGHTIHTTTDPEGALDVLRSKVIDLVVVEIVLQRQDGLRLCQQIRQLNPYTPLIVVSERHEEEQIVRLLLSAADDYLTKPVSPRQFLARVHAVLRRSRLTQGTRWHDENLSIGEIALNLQQMQAVVNGKNVSLTPRELSLLHALMENANRVLSRDQLMQLAWGERFVGSPKAIDVTIQRLRKKIGPHLREGYIHSQRGFGYRFQMPRPHIMQNR